MKSNKDIGSSTSVDKTYRTLVRQRQDEEIKKKRKVVEMSAAEDIKRRRIQPANVASTDNSIVRSSKSAVAGETGKKNQFDKRERMDRADLLNVLLTLFLEHQYYKFDDLVEKTKQSRVWLKEILSDIAVLETKGIYRGLYELKPEYAAINVE
ncbi:General transcription factor IIF subunit 2 [Rhizoclosmatium sp. JEL0117]|nr:General transcription factor IIF subunit 2 [Rhizoclosmatium sp. JEL0117]